MHVEQVASAIIYGFAWVCFIVGLLCLIALIVYMRWEKIHERLPVKKKPASAKPPYVMQKSA